MRRMASASWSPQSQRREPNDVTGEALRVHAHQHVLLARHIALDEGHVMAAVQYGLVADGVEVAVPGRQRHGSGATHEALVPPPVLDEVGDGDDPEAMTTRESDQIG